jgi:carboxymethylenebutenolidase
VLTSFLRTSLLTAAAALLGFLPATAQSTLKKTTAPASCCAAPTVAFAKLGSRAAFRGNHLSPRPYHFQGAGASVTFPVAGGAEGHGYLVKSAKPSTKYLFVIHEWWGLNDYIKREVARYAEEMPDVNVLAVDLYDGAIATDPDAAGKLMQAVKPERAAAILTGAKTFAGAKARIGSVGWCFGGGWSLQTALLNSSQAAGCVMYYGMPETDAAKLAKLRTPVLGIFATQDQWISPKVVADFEAAMKKAGKTLTVKSYDADHAFANPSNPKYSKEFAEDAHSRALAFLRTQLEGK